ncbi:unnamed protein product [Cuscuta campestris]|uniref:Uncharacterized protein n=1 Tax=Cuscuta campestris TaxID=132261 RepID=A0A484N1Y7_9ASTE|nr:unnamed protein product [Cuscuta campestris]
MSHIVMMILLDDDFMLYDSKSQGRALSYEIRPFGTTNSRRNMGGTRKPKYHVRTLSPVRDVRLLSPAQSQLQETHFRLISCACT